MKNKMSMTSKIMIAMILGSLVGLFLGREILTFKILGNIFLRLVQMNIIFLVVGQVIEAVGGVDIKKLGKIGIKTVIVFFVSSLLAAAYGIVCAVIFKPGISFAVELPQNTNLAAGKMSSFTNLTGGFMPSNIMEAIIFSIIFGIALSYLSSNKDNSENVVLKAIIEFNKIIIKMIMLIMELAPIGVFCLLASTVGKLGIDVIIPLLKYLIVYGIATFTFLIIWILVIGFYCKLNILTLIKKMTRMTMMALATISSAVTLPTALKDTEERLGIKQKVSKLVLSLGMSLNSNGSAMHMAITVIMISQIYGVNYTFSDYVYIAVLTTLSSLANAVVPGAGLVSLAIVVPQMGLPLESIALFAGVEWFVGMLRTILNVDSDVFSAFIVAKSENEIDYEIFNQNN